MAESRGAQKHRTKPRRGQAPFPAGAKPQPAVPAIPAGATPQELQKVWYSLPEVAVLWCDIRERDVSFNIFGVPADTDFPLLCKRAEALMDAVRHSELAATLQPPFPLAKPGTTYYLRHADVKKWMQQYHPAEKPLFLFPEADQDRVRILERQLAEAKSRIKALEGLVPATAADAGGAEPNAKSRANYERIIGSLVALMLGKTPAGKPNSAYRSQDAVIDAIQAHYPRRPGLSKRNLEDKFAEGARRLDTD